MRPRAGHVSGGPGYCLSYPTAAANDARTRFSEQAIVAQYEALYERTLAPVDNPPLHPPPFVPAIAPSSLPSIAAP